MNDADNPVLHAIESRQSIRAFRQTPVAPELLQRILHAASYAPSGSNIQPWKVHVLTGSARDQLSTALLKAFDEGEPDRREYQYYPVEWRAPYLERRRETGWGLYRTLGIAKGDREASKRQHRRNFELFDAPVVMLFTIDSDMGTGSWLDYGMFLQSIMVAARGLGLHTCPQAALANYPDIVKHHLGIPDDQTVVCGMSLGYANEDDVVNTFRPARMALDEFVTFHGDPSRPETMRDEAAEAAPSQAQEP